MVKLLILIASIKICSSFFCYKYDIEKLDHSVFSNDDIVFGDIDSDIVIFSNDIGLNSILLIVIFLMIKILTIVILKLLTMLGL